MAERTIILKGQGISKEAKAGGAITPGHLVVLNSSGNLIVHGVAGERTSPAFARENELAGNEISDAYAANDTAFYDVLPPGAEVYALVAASAPAIVIGDLLESAGDGTLRKIILLDVSAVGTANSTLENVGATNGGDVSGAIENNFADLGAKLNALKGSGIARALEAVDNSGGGSAARIIVEVL